jgi:hypothetical protein
MASATLSPKQLATLLTSLDDAQHRITAVRDELIRAMAARRRPPPARRARRARIARR